MQIENALIMPTTNQKRTLYFLLALIVSPYELCLFGDTFRIFWGTHKGTTSPIYDGSPFSNDYYNDSVSNPYELRGFNLAGTSLNDLANDSDGTNTTYNGDLVELGFFASALGSDNAVDGTGGNADSVATNLFQGTWVPLTSKTVIGHDFGAGTDVVAGQFYFESVFDDSLSDPNAYASHNENADSGYRITGSDRDIITNLDDRIALMTGTTPIGIRFYDIDVSNSNAGGGGITKDTDGTTRYNTIMNPDWLWPDSSDGLKENFFLHDATTPANLDSNLVYEFDNTTYGSGGTNVSFIGTSNVSVGTDDLVATITYHDGSSNLDVSDSGIGSTVVSAFDGTGTIFGANDDNVLTINSYANNSGANAYEFAGNFYNASSGTASTDLTIVKTGTGDQTLTGNINLAGDKGFLNVQEGTLTLKPGTADSQSVEYVTGSASGNLALDNTTVNAGTIVEFGLANTSSGDFGGTISLTGSGAANESKIKVSSGTATADYAKQQTFSGAIDGGDTLVKDGVGRLVLTGDSTTSFTGNITVEDGTLVIGDGGSSDGTNLDNDNTITINKGKLEIADNESVTLTAQGSSGSGKSMIGGKGTISTVTIGDASGEVDYISPGRGISSSLSPSKKGVDIDASTDSIGTLTVTTLNWNSGGVFDWQIKDFDPAGGTAGTDWDKLNFTTLNFESGQTFDINILAVQNDGTAGNVSNNSNTWNEYATNNGFLFLQGTTVNNLPDGDVSSSFNIRSDDFNYQIGHYYGDWGVYKDGGNFYLTYSAVPEPSTYIMVTGLFLLPGWRWIRRLRATAKEDDKSEA